MEVTAKTIEEFFTSADEREPDLRQLDEIIQQTLPAIDRQLVKGMNYGLLGYGMCHFKYASGKEGDWPVIAIAAQKNHISLYICAVRDGQYLPEIYDKKLGKVNNGKSCIRFKKFDDLNLTEVKNILRDAMEWLAEQPKPQL